MADEKKRPKPKSPKRNESLELLKQVTKSLSHAIPGVSDDTADTVDDSLARFGSGFASQIYGVDPEDGSVKMAAPTNILKDLNPNRGLEPPKFDSPGVVSDRWKEWARSGHRPQVVPGIVSDTASIPNILGNGPEWSQRMQSLANRTHEGVNDSMGLDAPQGFRQHALESLGMMAAQVPSEGMGLLKSAAPETKGALQYMKRFGKGLAMSPAEFLLPTVEPKISNYLFGSLAGGALGSLGDNVADDVPKPKTKAISSGYAGGGKVRAFNLFKDAVNARSGKDGMFSVLDQLVEDAPFEKATADQWKKYLKPGREAVREDVKFPLRSNELEWTGPIWEEAMRQPGRDFTKEDMLRYLRSGRPAFSSEITSHFDNKQWRSRGGMDYHEDLTKFDSPHHPGFEGSHFDPDTISWSRVQSMPNNDLLVDEVQSDLHQQATRKIGNSRVGYAKKGEEPRSGPDLAHSEALRRFEEDEGRPFAHGTEDEDLLNNILDEVTEDHNLIGGQPPETPFRDEGWVRHELQKNLLKSATHGYDSMSVIHPDAVQRRYGDNPGLGKFYQTTVIPELEKLAKRYGAKFDPGGVESGPSDVEQTWAKAIDDLGLIDVHDDMDHEELARRAQYAMDTMEENGFDADRLPPRVRMVLDNFAGATNHRYDPEALRTSIAMARNQIQNHLNTLNFDGRAKTNPRIQLDPELREKIKRIGVPLYSLLGGAAIQQGQSDDEEPAQYGEGGKVGALAQAVKALNLNPKATLSARNVPIQDAEQAVQQAVATLPKEEQASYINRIFNGDTDSLMEALEDLHRRLFPARAVEEQYARPLPPPPVKVGTHGTMSDEEFNRRVLGIGKARGGLASIMRMIRSN